MDLRRKGLDIGALDPNFAPPGTWFRDYDAYHARGFRVQGLRALSHGAFGAP
jgi:hypothetical protein